MFFGKDFKIIDSKLRLSIPSKFRKIAESTGEVDGFYLALGQGPFIKVYTRSEWRRLEKRLGLLKGREDFDSMQRDFLADVEWSQLDKQGRIALTKDHYDTIGRKSDVAVVGSGDHFEIWPREDWEAYRRDKVETNKTEMWRELNRLREGDV